MKKRIMIILLAFLLSIVLPQTVSYAEKTDRPKKETFVFPAALQWIEEEAFAETSARDLLLPEKLGYIGDNAFGEVTNLRNIYILSSTVFISNTAFPKNTELTMYVIEGSSANKWAEEHQIRFVLYKTDYSPAAKGKINNAVRAEWFKTDLELDEDASLIKKTREERSMRPQDRPELNPIDYRFP